MPSAYSDALITATDLIIGSASSVGGRMELNYDMTLLVTNVTLADGPCAGGRGCSPPELTVTGNALVLVTNTITVGADTAMLVDSTAPMEVGGDFVNQTQDRFRFRFEAGLMLLNGVSPQSFEVAGQDVSAVPDGFTNNFAMGRLEISTNGAVTFSDQFDNDWQAQDPCTEALYVDTLVLQAGSTITLDKCRIYYRQAEGLDVATIIIPMGTCGELVQVPMGDFDGDGDVDLVDHAVFFDCLAGPDTTPTPTLPTTAQDCLGAFDFNLDTDVDLDDFTNFQEAFTG